LNDVHVGRRQQPAVRSDFVDMDDVDKPRRGVEQEGAVRPMSTLFPPRSVVDERVPERQRTWLCAHC
jgi:hypothetical protein